MGASCTEIPVIGRGVREPRDQPGPWPRVPRPFTLQQATGIMCRQGVPLAQAWVVSVLVATVFIAMAGVRLSAQGLYYDELLPATGAFTYRGQPPELFCGLTIHGIPVLNVSYTGALKTALYGLYLRSTGRSFEVISWRLLGIGIVALGMVAFGVIARQGLSLGALLLFFAFLLTDATVLLTTRHDWGPVGLALLFRLLFLGAWIRWEAQRSVATAFGLGAVVGVALFEKLSSATLLGPLALAILAMATRRRLGHGLACGIGWVVGTVPLVLVNLYTYLTQGMLISFADVAAAQPHSFSRFAQFLGNYLSLADGVQVRHFILGATGRSHGEGCVLALLGLFLTWVLARQWLRQGRPSLAAFLLAGYLAVAVGLYLLPNPTWTHHWILGTPFQYATVALVFVEQFTKTKGRDRPGMGSRLLFIGLIAAILAQRVPTIYAVEKALIQGDSSGIWDPSLTRFGEALGPRLHNSVLIAADWGVATQPYCFAGGPGHRVYQPFWGYQGVPQLEWIIRDSGTRTCYLAVPRLQPALDRATTQRIIEDMSQLPGWKEVGPEADLLELRAVEVRKFVQQ